MSVTPPRLAARLLARVFRHDPAGASIPGDLREDFVRIHRRHGPRAATLWYWKEALLLAGGRVFVLSPGGRVMNRRERTRALLQDAGAAGRVLRRNPAFSLFVACVIGLGVGATTAVFSVLKPLLLAPLPFDDAERLVWIANRSETVGDNSLSAVTSRTGNLRDFRERSRSFVGLTGFYAFSGQRAYTMTGTGEPERLVGMGVAHDFLEVLRVEPLHGRSFTEQEGLDDGPPAVILSHAFWQRRFAADPEIIGQAITLNGNPVTVVGVLPASFDFSSIFAPGLRVDVLLPFPISEETDQQGNTMVILGRLRPGSSVEAAQSELDAIIADLQAEQPRRWGLAARVSALQAHIAEPFRPALLLLAAASAVVLLIVCVNVSNLLLARSSGRAREVAVRKALGASRARVLRQLMFETVGVALAGAAIGGGIAWLATELVTQNAASAIPMLDRVTLDATTFAFGAGIALLTGVAVGLVPALRVAEGREAAVLRASGRGSSASRGARRMREWLVLVEVALACVLLVVGALLVRSFQSVLDVDLGFEPANLVAWQINPSVRFESLNDEVAYYGNITARISAETGVEAVGLIDALPLGRTRSWGFSVVGVPEDEDTEDSIYPHMIDPGYLPTMRIPLVAGRNFSEFDRIDAPPVVLLNEAGARRVFGENALGRRIRLWDDRQWEVVGIVRDVRHVTPETDPGIQVYFPIMQIDQYRALDLVVRSSLATAQVSRVISTALRDVDPLLPSGEFWTMRLTVDRALSARRFTLGILIAFGAAALFLAGLGIYGVLSCAVAERRPEIGIRMALGASALEVVRSVIGRMLVLTAAGILAGAVLSLWSARLLGTLLYGVRPTDPFAFLAMALLLVLVTAAAGAVPAARAARTRAMGVLSGD